MLLHPRDCAHYDDAVGAHVETAIAHRAREAGVPSADTDGIREAVELSIGTEVPLRVGKFRFYIEGQRWEWSANHKHSEVRQQVAAVVDKVADGGPFSSRHRIIDSAGHTRWVVVVGDRMHDEAGVVVGTSGFYVDLTDVMQSDISDAVIRASESRAEIEQAKGLLMAAYGISADRAFELLVWRSQETNVKVREVARNFIATMAGGLAPDMRK